MVGAFRRRDGWIDLYLRADHFLAASGAPIALETTVTAIETNGGKVTGVMTNRGRIATETSRPRRRSVQSRYQPGTDAGRASGGGTGSSSTPDDAHSPKRADDDRR